MEIIHSHRTPSGKIYFEYAIEESEFSSLPTNSEVAGGSKYQMTDTGEVGNFKESTGEWIPLFTLKED